MSEQEARSQEEVPTLSALKAAATVIPDPRPGTRGWDTGDWADYHYARAEFWRLAFKWRDGPNGCGASLDDYDAGMKIVAEVEARK